jgi:hypothetical protein
MMNRRTWLSAIAGAAALALAGERSALLAAPAAARVLVYKTPTCGCCSKWVEHLQGAGFEVTVRDVNDLASIKRRYGIPASAGSCHTGLVEGYALEGHVPADLVQRLLRERPRAVGLAVPGMPAGSPGMESSVRQAYDVLLIQQGGAVRVYAKR